MRHLRVRLSQCSFYGSAADRRLAGEQVVALLESLPFSAVGLPGRGMTGSLKCPYLGLYRWHPPARLCFGQRSDLPDRPHAYLGPQRPRPCQLRGGHACSIKPLHASPAAVGDGASHRRPMALGLAPPTFRGGPLFGRPGYGLAFALTSSPLMAVSALCDLAASWPRSEEQGPPQYPIHGLDPSLSTSTPH